MRYILSLSCFILLFSCTKPKQANEITKVELAQSGTWFHWGATVSIDSSLNYKYWGDYKDVKQGYFTGKISAEFWDTLNQKFEEVNFKTVSPNSKILLLDAGYDELIIYWKNGRRRITRYWDGGQEPITGVFGWLSSYRNIKLTQVDTPFRFETTAHIVPKIDQVKFPPPRPKPKSKKDNTTSH